MRKGWTTLSDGPIYTTTSKSQQKLYYCAVKQMTVFSAAVADEVNIQWNRCPELTCGKYSMFYSWVACFRSFQFI